MKNIKLVAIDLDDTLLDNEKKIEPKAFEMIRDASEQGVMVVISTGRGIASAGSYALELGLESPLISGNGARISSSAGGDIWKHSLIPGEIAMDIALHADKMKWDLIVSTGDELIRSSYTPKISYYHEFRAVKSNREAVLKNTECIISENRETVMFVETLCRKKYKSEIYTEVFEDRKSGVFYAGVQHSHATKGNALDFLAKKLGIEKKEIMAIGDNINDISMFSRAGTSIAVENAHDDVKSLADHIVPSNIQGGVAYAIRKFVL